MVDNEVELVHGDPVSTKRRTARLFGGSVFQIVAPNRHGESSCCLYSSVPIPLFTVEERIKEL